MFFIRVFFQARPVRKKSLQATKIAPDGATFSGGAHDKLSAVSAKEIISFFKNAEGIFGVSFTKTKTVGIPAHIREPAKEREKLRKEKKWAEADAIREQIQKEGYEIKDSEKGCGIRRF